MASTAPSAVPTSARGPAGSTERILAPDLARGLMLLLIALANVPWFLYATTTSGLSTVHGRPENLADQVVQFVMITAVDMRIYPMFAFLFGYGIVQLYRRQARHGTPEVAARRLLRRRHLWMIVFGLVDAALLWYGDILGAYGLAGLVLVALFLRRQDKTLLVWAAVFGGLLIMMSLVGVIGSFFAAQVPPEGEVDSFFGSVLSVNGNPDYLASMLGRLGFWAVLTPAQGLATLAVPLVIVLAFWAARRLVLERPGDHLPLLRRVMIGGLAIGWLGGLPHALFQIGLLPVPEYVSWVFSLTQSTTGVAAGLGYVAAFALLAHRVQARSAPSPVVVAIGAVGRRSLSCYLAQSLLFATVLCGWGLGLGAHLGSATAAAYAFGVWLLTVLGATLLETRGRRGPAEVLLRRLTYGRTA